MWNGKKLAVGRCGVKLEPPKMWGRPFTCRQGVTFDQIIFHFPSDLSTKVTMRQNDNFIKPKLPKALLDQIGGQSQPSSTIPHFSLTFSKAHRLVGRRKHPLAKSAAKQTDRKRSNLTSNQDHALHHSLALSHNDVNSPCKNKRMSFLNPTTSQLRHLPRSRNPPKMLKTPQSSLS